MSQKEWVPEVTLEAMRRISAHAEKVGPTNTDEFTFRAFFMAAAYDAAEGQGLEKTLRFQTEWHRFDLLVQLADVPMLIEFKYYVIRRTLDLDGKRRDFKGGPGPQNLSEFHAALRGLRAGDLYGVSQHRLIVVYLRDDALPKGQSWHKTFGGLQPDFSIAQVWQCASGPFEARILEPTNPLPPGSSPGALTTP
ncbi:hypothetical protein O2W18_20995 [Modestobacter sp. VKM Ac-2983]|uniref:hypothetical protein n=1 Tax=Modestobacter sp. VKM Ac-2983 TaxID=3004137 RepID=UPI0022ABC2DA|nr:hypothetical protein [Modestobacter sp. VKM Ac-2983]MCZ2807591.1 hypothetical protein [Modestobacter sp. VKM Ac-2983]